MANGICRTSSTENPGAHSLWLRLLWCSDRDWLRKLVGIHRIAASFAVTCLFSRSS